MPLKVIECPGCLSKIRVRTESHAKVECPRCMQALDTNTLPDVSSAWPADRSQTKVLFTGPTDVVPLSDDEAELPSSSIASEGNDEERMPQRTDVRIPKRRQEPEPVKSWFNPILFAFLAGAVSLALVFWSIVPSSKEWNALFGGSDSEKATAAVTGPPEPPTDPAMNPNVDASKATQQDHDPEKKEPEAKEPEAKAVAENGPNPGQHDAPRRNRPMGAGNAVPPEMKQDGQGNAPAVGVQPGGDPVVAVPPGDVVKPNLPELPRPKNANGKNEAPADLPEALKESVERATRATAILNAGAKSGTAFCVHSAGLFVTTAHLVDAVKANSEDHVMLTVNAGTDKVRAVLATVIRVDEESDIAILQTSAALEIEALTPKTTDHLAMGSAIYMMGFPERDVVVDPLKLPKAGRVDGRIRSMRREEGILRSIRLEATPDMGFSGGPLLDQDGQLVGVIQPGVLNSDLHFAIPIERVTALLQEPVFFFHVPGNLEIAEAAKPFDVSAEIIGLKEGLEATDYEVSVRVRQPQDLPAVGLTRDGLRFSGTLDAVREEAAGQVSFTAEFDNASLSGVLPDSELRVGNKTLHLSEVLTLVPGPDPESQVGFETHDGDRFRSRCDLSVLSSVETTLAGQKTRLDLRKARRIELEPIGDVQHVEVAFEVRHQMKLIEERVLTIPVGRDADQINILQMPGAPGQVFLNPAANGENGGANRGPKEARDIRLPGLIDQAIPGYSGRMLFLRLPTLQQLAVVDLASQKIVRYLPLPSPDAMVAAGAEKLIVLDQTKGTLVRYGLPLLDEEVTKPIPEGQRVIGVAMGHSASGPILLARTPMPSVPFSSLPPGPNSVASPIVFLDASSLREIEVQSAMNNYTEQGIQLLLSMHPRFRASADGTVFTICSGDAAAFGSTQIQLSGNDVSTVYSTLNLGYMVPSYNGRFLCTSQGILPALGEVNELMRIMGNRGTPGLSIPVLDANFFLQAIDDFDALNPGQQVKWTLCHYGNGKPGVILPDINESLKLALDDLRNMQAFRNPDQRMFVSLQSRAAACISADGESVRIVPFSLADLLQNVNEDYLIVESNPATTWTSGRLWTYSLNVLSKRGGVRVRLDVAPEGMAFDEKRVLTWKPTRKTPDAVPVVIAVSDDSGQEVLHSFTIRRAARPGNP